MIMQWKEFDAIGYRRERAYIFTGRHNIHENFHSQNQSTNCGFSENNGHVMKCNIIRRNIECSLIKYACQINRNDIDSHGQRGICCMIHVIE